MTLEFRREKLSDFMERRAFSASSLLSYTFILRILIVNRYFYVNGNIYQSFYSSFNNII